MQIIPLSEGTFTVDATKIFVPFDAGHDELQKRPSGSLLVEIQPFVIITSKDVLLLDTGLGFKKDGSLQLHQNLERNGIHPSRVTKVLLTHLHKDHAGGIVRPHKDRQLVPGQPRCTHTMHSCYEVDSRHDGREPVDEDAHRGRCDIRRG